MALLALFGFEMMSICSTYSIFIGGNIYSYRYLPKGDCRLCCPVQKDIDITFNLFTRNNPTLPQQLVIDDLWSIRESYLDPANPTVFYVHGFTERAMGLSARTVKNAYLERGDVNMIVVDWGSLCSFPYYAAAVKNTRVVGKYLAKFLQFLHNSHIIPIDAVHVIGFSLGAEVAGFTGKALGKNVLPRITGLDPAFPLYIFQGDIGHLAKTDAKFVDVIHTDGGVFGFPNPIGHADFYPNGGIALQPGCRLSQLSRRGHPEEVVACSHNRAWGYYSESVINEFAFPAYSCKDYDSFMRGNCSGLYSQPAYMGSVAGPKHQGKFYLTTNDSPPFGFYTRIATRGTRLVWFASVRHRHVKPLSPYPIDYSKVDKVTICGAMNPLGQHLAFMLKNAEIIREVALYDECNTRGLALDLEHMNTRTKVKPNSGDYALKDALKNSDIVVITNGFDTSLNSDENCLKENARMIYKYGIKVASVCPDALVCIITPPINIMVQIFSEAMKACQLYDPNKIFGVPSLVEMRANSIVAEYLCIDPAAINVPIIGGVTPQTVVPILSHAKPYNEFTDAEIQKLTCAIMEVPEQCQKLHTAAPLSTAYALSRFILTLGAGLCCCQCAVQTAFVRSDVLKQSKYFASGLRTGIKGVVENYGIPKLLDCELNLLSQALVVLENDFCKACAIFNEIHGDARRDEIEELRRPMKPFFIKTPCPPCPPCFPTDVCQEKLPADPCAPPSEAWSF